MAGKEKRGILTLAVGKKYRNQAKYLAYSCMLHCPELLRAIITDNEDDIKGIYDFVIPYDKSADPFETKLMLNRYTPFEETLFLDADILVYGSLRFMFEYFDDQSFVYVGKRRIDGIWNVDMKSTIEKFNIPWMGKLNSGVFLFKNDRTGNDVFEFAHALHGEAEKLDMPFFRGTMYADEPFLAIAFGKYLQKPLEKDYGRFGRLIINKKAIHIDIIKGYARYYSIIESQFQFPAVIHFSGGHKGLYLRERIKLFCHLRTPLGYFAVALVSNAARIMYVVLIDGVYGLTKRIFMKVARIAGLQT